MDNESDLIIPPTLEEVESYCKKRGYHVNPQFFFEYYEAGDWHDKHGNPVTNWKQRLVVWEEYTLKREEEE